MARIDQLLAKWTSCEGTERARRLLDLFLVSVLLDAGAGDVWQYKAEDGNLYNRSEGLAVASLEMFAVGAFSSDAQNPYQVNSAALQALTPDRLAQLFQVSEDNPLSGVDGRHSLLLNLGHSLATHADIFGRIGRPGHMLDYLQHHPSSRQDNTGGYIFQIEALWEVLMKSLELIWPSTRLTINSVRIGDAWPCQTLARRSNPEEGEHSNIAPFHKLTQWLAYSLMSPMTRLAAVKWQGEELLTGLPEYRNGGLFIDSGVLQLKPEQYKRGTANSKIPKFSPDDDVIVEWRALTVAFLDVVHEKLNKHLGTNLSLAQVLEAGTWKAGRVIAREKRDNGGPPVAIASDGTVF